MGTPDLDELEYLAADFDASTLTVPRLRYVLVSHEVKYPSSAKKAELVDLFNEQVKPKGKRILSQRARTKRSTRNIEDVPSSQEPSEGVPEEEESVTSPGRRVPRRAQDLDETQTPIPPSTVKRGRRTATAETEPDTAKKATSRRSRVGVASPQLKSEEIDEAWLRHDEDSPFTSDNPFQSGSSPLAAPFEEENRRRTVGVAAETRKKRPSTRRKTDFPTANGEIGTRQPAIKYEVPDEELSAGEEFTAAEQAELERQEQTGVISRPVRPKPKPASSPLRAAAWIIPLALLGGVGTLWRQEKLEVGFCGIGTPSEQIAGVAIPEWADTLRPQCEPCPPHAYCYANLEAKCEPDFVLAPHPLSLGGVVPLPPTCEPDSEKTRKVQAVADRAVEELRERNAQFECGELKDDTGKPVDTPEISEPELKEIVSAQRKKSMTQEEYENLWDLALGDLISRDEIVSNADGSLFSPTDAPPQPQPPTPMHTHPHLQDIDTAPSPSAQPPTPKSPSHAQSDSPSEQRWSDIFARLSL